MFVQEKEMKGYKHKQHRKQREFDRWGHFKGIDTIGLQGAFDMNPCLLKSMCRYDGKRGVLSMNSYFETDNEDWLNESQLQRKLGRELRGIVGADREHSLCVCTNGTRLRYGDKKGAPMRRFVQVEYYAKCRRPEPDKVQEMARTIRDCLDNGYV